MPFARAHGSHAPAAFPSAGAEAYPADTNGNAAIWFTDGFLFRSLVCSGFCVRAGPVTRMHRRRDSVGVVVGEQVEQQAADQRDRAGGVGSGARGVSG